MHYLGFLEHKLDVETNRKDRAQEIEGERKGSYDEAMGPNDQVQDLSRDPGTDDERHNQGKEAHDASEKTHSPRIILNRENDGEKNGEELKGEVRSVNVLVKQ